MPCPFTGPKMFCAGPNFLTRTKNLLTYCASHKHFVPDQKDNLHSVKISVVFSGGAGGARAPPEFGGSQKGQSLISAYLSLAITTKTPGFEL